MPGSSLLDKPELAAARIDAPSWRGNFPGIHLLARAAPAAPPPAERLAALLRFEAERARGLLVSVFPLAEALGGRVGKSVALFARGGLAALGALERASWDVFSGRPAPTRWTFLCLTIAEL